MDDGKNSKSTERPRGSQISPALPREPVPDDSDVYNKQNESRRQTFISNDGVSAMSRFSSLSIPGMEAALVSTFSPGSHRQGCAISPISEYGKNRGHNHFALADISPEEAAHRKNSATPSLVHAANQRLTPAFRQSLQPQESSNGDSSSLHIPEWPCNWLPLYLRLPYLRALIGVTIALGGLVLGLTVASDQKRGLGPNSGSSAFLFGWRFVPTILVVVYMVLVAAMVNDVKRTEVFARLSHPAGASASASLFWKARLLWVDPFVTLSKRRNNGVRSWALFWASVVNIFGLLIIIPFSSALIYPTEVVITKSTSFSRVNLATLGPTELFADQTILSRTISTLLLNTPTSPWINNNYTIVPFSPSLASESSSGSILSTNLQQWTANTMVFQTSLDCSPMTLQSFSNYTMNATLVVDGDTSTYIPTNLTSFTLVSSDNCTLGYSGLTSSYVNNSIWSTGGAWWSKASNFTYPLPWSVSNGTIARLDLDHPIIINASSQCGNRTMMVMAAPEVYGIIQAKGYICTSNYYSATIPVTVTNTGSASDVSFDTSIFEKSKIQVSPNILDIAALENAFLSQNWTTDYTLPSNQSSFSGPTSLLAAKNAYNMSTMMGNTNFLDQARQVKQRFLGESMQIIFNNSTSQNAEKVTGSTNFLQYRIVVSFRIGILLTFFLFSSALMISMVTYHTRLSTRPLNIHQDPSSTIGVASLIKESPGIRTLFEGLEQCSEEEMVRQLDGYVFSLRSGVLWSYDQRDAYQQGIASDMGNETKCYPVISRGSHNWPPRVLSKLFLVLLLVFLLILAIILAVLYVEYSKTGIYQKFQVYSIQSHFGVGVGAPCSIISTLIAVFVKVWWSSLNGNMRSLQPYISMASGPTPRSRATDVSYTATPTGWTIWEAFMNKHWFLAAITMGTIFTELFIISMSGVWIPQTGIQSQNVTLPRSLELRTSPITYQVPTQVQNASDVLTYAYGNLPTLLLSSSNQSSISWAKDDWSFVPVQLASTLEAAQSILTPPSNISVSTSAIQGLLQCTAIETSNSTSWIAAIDLANAINTPCNLTTGYQLLAPFAPSRINSQEGQSASCDASTNSTNDASSIISWTTDPNNLNAGIIITYVTGNSYSIQLDNSTNTASLIWSSVPSINALNCTPTFQTASAKVMIDASTGMVHNYTLLSAQQPDQNAWTNGFTGSNNAMMTTAQTANGTTFSTYSVPVSYGPILSALITAYPLTPAMLSTVTGANVDLTDPTSLGAASAALFGRFVNTFAANALPMSGQPNSTNVIFQSAASTQSSTGSLTSPATHLTALPSSTIMSIVLLVLLLLIILFTLFTTQKQLNHLPRNPSSLGSTIGLIHSSDALLATAPSHNIPSTGEINPLQRAQLHLFVSSANHQHYGIDLLPPSPMSKSPNPLAPILPFTRRDPNTKRTSTHPNPLAHHPVLEGSIRTSTSSIDNRLAVPNNQYRISTPSLLTPITPISPSDPYRRSQAEQKPLSIIPIETVTTSAGRNLTLQIPPSTRPLPNTTSPRSLIRSIHTEASSSKPQKTRTSPLPPSNITSPISPLTSSTTPRLSFPLPPHPKSTTTSPKVSPIIETPHLPPTSPTHLPLSATLFPSPIPSFPPHLPTHLPNIPENTTSTPPNNDTNELFLWSPTTNPNPHPTHSRIPRHPKPSTSPSIILGSGRGSPMVGISSIHATSTTTPTLSFPSPPSHQPAPALSPALSFSPIPLSPATTFPITTTSSKSSSTWGIPSRPPPRATTTPFPTQPISYYGLHREAGRERVPPVVEIVQRRQNVRARVRDMNEGSGSGGDVEKHGLAERWA